MVDVRSTLSDGGAWTALALKQYNANQVECTAEWAVQFFLGILRHDRLESAPE